MLALIPAAAARADEAYFPGRAAPPEQPLALWYQR